MPQESGAAALATSSIALLDDPTVSPPWRSYYDSVARNYLYLNTSTRVAQYEHPFPPVFSSSDTVVTDATTSFLSEGWIKLQSAAKKRPYYLYIPSLETRWINPYPPPDPSGLTPVVDVTLKLPYKKYTDPTTGKPFYVNSDTLEVQWNFPDSAFDAGPSTAQQASSAVAQAISGAQQSSAVAQTTSSAKQSSAVASSAVAQTASSARQMEALSEPLAAKKDIVDMLRATQEYILAELAIIYSPRSSPLDIATAKQALMEPMNQLYSEWAALAEVTGVIFSIAPMYQDRVLQTHVVEPSVEEAGYIKLYDSMRKTHVIIDSNGYLVNGIDTVAGRPMPVLPPPPPPSVNSVAPPSLTPPPVIYIRPSSAIVSSTLNSLSIEPQVNINERTSTVRPRSSSPVGYTEPMSSVVYSEASGVTSPPPAASSSSVVYSEASGATPDVLENNGGEEPYQDNGGEEPYQDNGGEEPYEEEPIVTNPPRVINPPIGMTEQPPAPAPAPAPLSLTASSSSTRSTSQSGSR